MSFWQGGGDLSTLSQLMPADTDVRITREFDAVYAAEELARLHGKSRQGPVAHLFAQEDGCDR